MKIKIIFLVAISFLSIQCSSDDNTNDSGSRITSYNVCYTKLLRKGKSTTTSALSTARITEDA